QRKVEGQEIIDEPTEAPQTKIIDLMDALKASLARGGTQPPDGPIPAQPAEDPARPGTRQRKKA
ncbi:MAG: Ku protein, partial [Gemmatimonadota bacterium]